MATVDENSFACIIFDLINADKIVAYAGHFITQKDLIFDPKTREPVVSDLLLLDASKSIYNNPLLIGFWLPQLTDSIFLFTDHPYLSLFGTANANLLLLCDYFLYRNDVPYQELIMRTQNIFTTTMQQQQQSNVYS